MVRIQKTGGLGRLLTAALCIGLCFCLCTPAFAVVETDEDGGVWDYDNGTYTAPDGTVYPITPGGTDEEGEGSGSGSGEGSQNGDGSITIPSGTGGTGEEQSEGVPLTAEEWAARLAHAADINGSYTPTVYKDPTNGNLYEVTVKYMGIGRSMIEINGQERLVNTVDLQWVTQAPEDMVLAVINTPKNGHARMYAGKSKKSTLIEQCRLDQVVRVINTGKTWTLVDHNGRRGYIHTGSLEFFANDHTDFVPAVISVKGRTKGKDTANIRSRDKTARVLTDYALGTPLTVFDIVDEWAEVDVCGWHCRINTKFLTLEKEMAMN